MSIVNFFYRCLYNNVLFFYKILSVSLNKYCSFFKDIIILRVIINRKNCLIKFYLKYFVFYMKNVNKNVLF